MNPDEEINENQDEVGMMPAVDEQALQIDVPTHVGQPVAAPVLQHAPIAPIAPVTGIPVSADDVDLIEKEWVEKAKEIVDRTQGDPYAQSKQLSQMKAEYIKKRYNRDLKVSES